MAAQCRLSKLIQPTPIFWTKNRLRHVLYITG